MTHQDILSFETPGRGTTNITDRVNAVVQQSDVTTGVCSIFIKHTSASLILCENADPQVRADLEAFMSHLVPDGDPLFRHTAEGPDDMPAHVRTTLTDSGLTIPVCDGQLGLGVWQGVYLWEHRHRPHTRSVVVTLLGD